MKLLLPLLIATATAATSLAGPLEKAHVSADAKWVLHLDAQALLATQIGGTLGRELLDPKMTKPTADLKQMLDFDFDWRRIRSLTMYGWEFGGPERTRGVLLIDTDLDVAKGLETALERQAQWGKSPDDGLKRLEDGPSPLYCVNEDVYIALRPGSPVVIGKARKTVVRARDVLAGNAGNLAGTQSFAEFAPLPNSFFFLAAAQGFSDAEPVPPQAKVLKLAESLRVILAEAGDRLQASLALSTKTEESAQQVYQVAQGLLALVALGQVENADLQDLAKSVRVTMDNRVVQVSASLSAGKLTQKILEKERQKQQQ